jgi:hypothetical protein
MILRKNSTFGPSLILMSEIGFESIEALFKSEYSRFYALAYNLVRDKDAAKDIVQKSGKD